MKTTTLTLKQVSEGWEDIGTREIQKLQSTFNWLEKRSEDIHENGRWFS